MDNRTSRTLASTSLVGLLLFPVIVVTLNAVQAQEYSAVSQAMSELALGRYGWLMALAFVSMGVGTILLGVLLRAGLRTGWLAPGCLVLAGALDLVSAAFRTNGTGPQTTTSTVHMFAGISSFVLVILAMGASVRAFNREARWRWFAFPTSVWTGVAVAAFFLVPVMGDARFGVAQRIFVAVWLSWLVVVAYHFRKLDRADLTGSGQDAERQETVNS